MKKYFILSDIHGFYDLLITKPHGVSSDINYKNHIFVFS